MRRGFAWGFLAFSMMTAASAEPPIGSRLGDRIQRGPVKNERDSAIGAQEMARCLATKQTNIVRRFLATVNKAENESLRKKMSGGQDCFMTPANDFVEGRFVAFPNDIFRGMLAEWMIKNDERTFAVLPVLPRQLTYSRSWYALTGRDASVDEMATCVTEIAPAETVALLKSDPYSEAEGAEFGALGPHLGECLRAGVKVTGNRQSLRAALADALYQRVANPPAAVPTGGEIAH